MRGFSLHTLIPVLSLLCIPAFSQGGAVVRIGVPALRSGNNTVSGAEARDQLVKDLNRHKSDKKIRLAVTAIPLESPWGSKAMVEAQEKSCEFVLSTHLTDLQASSVLTNNGLAGMDYVPVYIAAVEYRLIRVADTAGIAIGSVKEQDPASPAGAVRQAVTRVARQALADLEKGGNVPHGEALLRDRQAEQLAPKQIEVMTFAPDPCAWLPTNIPHADAVAGVCQYAMSLPNQMPNFICDQAASRYRGNSTVPFDLITASVRYEDGNESYTEIKLNGRPAPTAITQSPGLWSTGEFGSDLRSIFDPRNQALFEFARENKLGNHDVWVFTYRIVKQNDPLSRLHGGDEVSAPPYDGELWVDEKSGQLLRFGSVAQEIPETFPMLGAQLQVDYAIVAFADGSSFVLPADFAVTTTYRGEEATRNVVQFRNCHKFRAKTRMLLNVP